MTGPYGDGDYRRPLTESERAAGVADPNHFARQDNATHLGIFVDDEFVRRIENGEMPWKARERAPFQYRVHPDRITVLALCNDHPDTAAVDCDRHED